MQIQSARQELLGYLHEINDLSAAASILSWDQTTYMPIGGAPARSRQLATLERIAHEKICNPAIGRLLDTLQPYADQLPHDHDDAALVRVTRREFERATRVPADFVGETAQHLADSYTAWTQARPHNDFAAIRPLLEKTLDYSRRYAQFFPGYDHILDPLIEEMDYGMTVATIRPVFDTLAEHLASLVAQIAQQPITDDSCLYQHFSKDLQWNFGIDIIRCFGYDFERGRQDTTLHPYMTKFSLGDVRITTRLYENDLSSGLFSTMHEAGHALYEQGIDNRFEATPLAEGTSSCVHESQSRLWENLVGRSWAFWQHFYPKLQAIFPQQLHNISLEMFHRAINKVQPSLIRVEADEVTYNLHVIIRFQLEIDLLEGTLAIKDLPEAWNERYQALLGIRPPGDQDGVLQDVHWYASFIGGAFQGYTLGNILAAQFYSSALEAHPSIERETQEGNFSTLHNWLRTHIYCHGSKFTTHELLTRVTGGPLRIEPYIQYLNQKYGSLYRLTPVTQR